MADHRIDYPLHTTGTAYVVGDYLVTCPQSEGEGYRVMENFGSYRMLKKVFKTGTAAVKRAEGLSGVKA